MNDSSTTSVLEGNLEPKTNSNNNDAKKTKTATTAIATTEKLNDLKENSMHLHLMAHIHFAYPIRAGNRHR